MRLGSPYLDGSTGGRVKIGADLARPPRWASWVAAELTFWTRPGRSTYFIFDVGELTE